MNRIRSLACASVFGALASLALTACDGSHVQQESQPGAQQRVLSFEGTAWGTTWNARAVADTARFAEILRTIKNVIQDVDRTFSTWIPESELSRFNAHDSTEPFEASAELVSVVRTALDLARATEGAYDPTILPVLLISPPRARKAPTEEQLAAARDAVGWDRIEVVDDTHLRKTDPRVQFESSSLAKGYGVDRVSEALLDVGVESHLIEVGGEIVCRGKKPDGADWMIQVEAPPAQEVPESSSYDPEQFSRILPLRDRGRATSGHYRQFVESNGKKVSHIVDARTGELPGFGVISVSVEAPDCTTADGLATALLVADPVQVGAILEAFGVEGVEVLMIVRDVEAGEVAVVQRSFAH